MSQLTAAVIDRLAVDEALPAEALGGDETGLDRPDGRVDGGRGHRDVVGGAQLRVEVEAELGGDHEHRLAEAGTEGVGHDARARVLGRRPEQHPVADDVGSAVGADVGELLGPDLGDRPGHGRDHQREALRDAAGMDAGAVQRDPGCLAHGVEPRPLLVGREEPTERRHHVRARLEDAGHDARVGHERRVDRAVGVDGEGGVDVAGGGDADRVTRR